MFAMGAGVVLVLAALGWMWAMAERAGGEDE